MGHGDDGPTDVRHVAPAAVVAGRVDREQHVRRDRDQDAERQPAVDESLDRSGAQGLAHDEGARESYEDERRERASVLSSHVGALHVPRGGRTIGA
jgi:hypothetical protein